MNLRCLSLGATFISDYLGFVCPGSSLSTLSKGTVLEFNKESNSRHLLTLLYHVHVDGEGEGDDDDTLNENTMMTTMAL